MRNILPALAGVVVLAGPAAGQGAAPAPAARVERVTLVTAARLVDVRTGDVLRDAAVRVEGGRIAAVGRAAELARALPAGAARIDLGDHTLLPGLIDAHTHVLLQGDISQQDWDDQLLRESIPYRAIRAVAAARRALEQGFTTLRDIGNEGTMWADVDVKRAIARGVVPGPRLLVATRAFAPTGMYPPSPQAFSWELDLPSGVQHADGVEEIRKAVREQVAHGADWIKVYADRGYYYAEDGRLRSRPNWTEAEFRAFVEEAERLGRRVAAHAVGWDGIDAALRAGVASIEHGFGMTPDLMERMKAQGAVWVPTIHVLVYVAPGRGGITPRMVETERLAIGEAVRRGVAIANGSDAGGFDWHTEPLAAELRHLERYGMTRLQALQAATTVAARLLGREGELGVLAPGALADLVAVRGNPLESLDALDRVAFVMKEGRVFRGPGAAP